MRFLSSLTVVAALLVLPATAGAVEVLDPKPGDPTGFSNQPSGNITLQVDADDVLTCTLDGAPISCTGTGQITIPYGPLADGLHSFIADDTGPTPLTENHDWTVDTLAPDTTISAGPQANSTLSSATFSFTSTEPTGATFQCSLDGGTAAACTSPVTYNSLANGSHTFSVRASDQATNADPTPATQTWTIVADTTPPETTITAAPSGANNLTSPAVEFTSNETGATFQCSVNGGQFSACSSPSILAALVDGAITFQVRAVDGNGNIDQTPASASWTKDTAAPAAPAVFIGRRAGAAQNATAPTATFQATTALRAVWNRAQDAASSEAQIRLTKAGTDPEAGTFRPLASGAGTQADAVIGTGMTGCVRVRSVDAAGNASAWTTKCTTVPFKATSATVRSPFKKHKGTGYFASQFVGYAGSGATKGYLRLQLTPAGSRAVVKRVSLVATKCRRCGAVRVVITGDGSPPVGEDDLIGDRTINLRSSRTQRTRVLTAVIFDSAAPDAGRRFVYVFAVGKGGRRSIEGLAVSAY